MVRTSEFRADVFLRVPPERRGGAPDPQQCGDRKQQAKSHIGKNFNLQEYPAGQFADTRDILFRNLFVHANPRFRPADRTTQAGAKQFPVLSIKSV